MKSSAAIATEVHQSGWNASAILKAVASANGRLRHPVISVLVGAAAFLVSFVLRKAVHPALPPGFPFVTFFPAVILSTFVSGARAGLVCAVLSGVTAWYYFIPPLNSFAIDGSVVTALALFGIVAGIDIALIHVMQTVTGQLVGAESAARALLDQQRRLVADLRQETQSRVMHQQLAEKSLLLDLALTAAQAGTWHYRVATGRALLSAEMARQHGLGEAEIEIDVERDWKPLVHPDDADQTLSALGHAIATKGPFETEFRICLPDGETRWVCGMGRVERDARGDAEWVVGLTFDVTARKLAEQRIAHLARHDPLTDLGNRTHFQEHFLREIALVKRGAPAFALLCLDLDGFKAVNDTLGHAAGDALLRLVAERLKASVRIVDTVARLGGDEFVVIQTGLGRTADATALAERLTQAIKTPFVIDGQDVSIGVSVGVALVPSDGIEADVIYRNADQALYRAKAAGRGTYRRAGA
ncbi:diguanylate cyclase domain-containing protein [Methylobacterium sp. J-077]|uniref:diguanylate cyclase domain-containing protein n=1 Tax=Methylobacterium sp. J-077 TaxID=2836656 RepID=UPI001FB86D3C|nr:diguanylate cyclase [Methylobacterium sp. J-077]MCJ2122507.1 diguanylate cyclase [Methylobacterium sp. J-077]